ncbi:MAG: hypothetical protein ACTSV3_00420 [Candidatus Thorarchaeota archaeon]|nr:MAG: hypothetical protein DRO87_07820 [Candidatus Thorarchaeota archaeon]RLI57753.1 MAG: hypothetical protein DRP09_01565 [Candidatus Thorarchaeota archaeon]
MQIDFILTLFSQPLFILLVILLVVAVACARLALGPKGPKEIPLARRLRKMRSQIDKGREIELPPVRSRQEIVTEIFSSQMSTLGLTPSTEGGHVPVSYTPLSRFLRERGVSDEIASAILDGLMEEDTEDAVRNIIDVATATPEMQLGPKDIEKARELAVQEWKNLRGRDSE